MSTLGVKNPKADLKYLKLKNVKKEYWNLSPEECTKHTVQKGMGSIASNGALNIMTGKFTGRSPKDRYIVKDEFSKDTVDWNAINKPISSQIFDRLYDKICSYLEGKELYIRDAYACADPQYKLNLRLVSEYPWSSLFGYNMFLRPDSEELRNFKPSWHILCAPGFLADPKTDGTLSANFAIINFSKKTIIIGGTGYTGEIKKGIFSVLNFILPQQHDVLAMHCSANVGKGGDTAVFFGLSGTGKTTLSADPDRQLIGDDEHGWSENSVFNFEGGCYAKVIDLTEEKEPEIFAAIKPGAILENVLYLPGTNEPDYTNTNITQNTRVSYPIYHIKNRKEDSMGQVPKNIFFLTADAFGVLPPISKLTKAQAMYQFISGYTAKVAGTEEGINEPQATFSACFGAPFLPLHPTKYAEMLGHKMDKHQVNIWLVNTGWSGGPYGIGSRIKLQYTRAMIKAALEGKLDDVPYRTHEIFKLNMPVECEGVPAKILNPEDTWEDKKAYTQKALLLASKFMDNFEQYADQASEEILSASPNTNIKTAN